MSEAEDRVYLSVSRAELDRLLKALAVAGAVDTGPELAALGNQLEGRAVDAREIVQVLQGAVHGFKSYATGTNAATDLAEGLAERCGALLLRLAGRGDPLALKVAADLFLEPVWKFRDGRF
ncbi:hypothetical protein V5F53_19280, partial [Xanthobacter sp. V4C-4]|uniref:hypothetical protein n=1 Tax=Xanthobacter cornucopiae TaxID=3119924 RepID=UPI00372A818A